MSIMKCLAANGIPFDVLRSPYWVEMVSKINWCGKGYKSPSSEKARTTLLDETKRKVEKDLAPLQATWYTQGVSVVSDGWSNIKQDPLINLLAANSRGAMFMHAANFSGVEKTGELISDFLFKAIDDIGPQNVIQVVTDNASNCVNAGKRIQQVHPHIFQSPCTVHTLNLIFKDLSKKFPWMAEIRKRGKKIVKFFKGHDKPKAMFASRTTKVLLHVASTRFASMYIMLKRLLDVRDALATTVVTKAWKTWLAKQDSHIKHLGGEVAEIINDDYFWEEAQNIVMITKPIWSVLKFCDGDGPKMGEIYERMDNLVGEVQEKVMASTRKDDLNEIKDIIVYRWDKMNIQLHCLAYALCPHFYDIDYLEAPAPGGFTRIAPNLDQEVMTGWLKALSRIGEDEDERKLFRDQFADFQMKKNIFSLPEAKADAISRTPIDWWTLYGSQAPQLAEVAKKILLQPVSSSSAERVWSTYGFIHNLTKNRLTDARADKLVYIHCNLRLIAHLTKEYTSGPCRKWNVDPEDPYLEFSPYELEDMRWKNLDSDFVVKGEVRAREDESSQPTLSSKRPRVEQVYSRKK